MAQIMGKDGAIEFLASQNDPSTPVVYDPDCYICNDPDFARAGLPLCRACPHCGGHIAADDIVCTNCGVDEKCDKDCASCNIDTICQSK